MLTVEQWLAAENDVARKEAQKSRIAAGAEQLPVVARGPQGPAPQVVTVNSISGLGDALRAEITTPDGQTWANVGPGTRVRSCEVERIAGACVVFKPAAANKAKSSAAICPTACWTGDRPAPQFAPFGTPGLPGQPAGLSGPLPPGGPGQSGMPLPMPAPMPAPIPAPATPR